MDRMRASFLVLLFLSGCLNETAPPQEDQEAEAIVERIQGKPLPNYPFNPPPISDPTVDSSGVLHDTSTNTYHPTMIARYALRRYGEWRADPTRSDSIEAALAQTQWLVDNLDCSTGHGTWRFDFPASFDTPPGWASGMTQAHGIVALLALAQFSPDPKRYVSAAMCATRAFGLDVDEGGVLTATREGSWYEEYATPSRSGVLNGHIFALGGLYYGCRLWLPRYRLGAVVHILRARYGSTQRAASKIRSWLYLELLARAGKLCQPRLSRSSHRHAALGL
jgi:hypothetical protein